MIYNVVSMSGGKDSTAMALLAIERGVENLRLVFADTGHENQQTYDYVDYLRGKLGRPIDVVKADFTARIVGKREWIVKHWGNDGVGADEIEAALVALKPTGIPMLDLILWKGRAPSTKAPFCSIELKQEPLREYQQALMVGAQAVVSWQGVRRDESANRASLPERDVEFGSWEPEPSGMLIYRPILDWSVEDVFAMHRKHGVEPNPLYKQGMGRVGCMPCINAKKDELRQIANRFPEEIDRVAQWEALASKTAKRGMCTFFTARGLENKNVNLEEHGIWSRVDWANTARGGRQRDIIHMMEEQEVPVCSSQYGLCE